MTILGLFPLCKLSLPLFRLIVSDDIWQKTASYFHADMFRDLRNVALSACVTESEFETKKETFEPTSVQIFFAQKPRGKELLFFPLPFRLYLSLLTLNFFPILYVLALAKNGIPDTPKGEKSGRSSCLNHLTISGFFPIRLHSVGVIP